MSGVFIIAEAGSTHENSLETAFRLIKGAKECGADACKFQFWSNSKALAERRKLPKAAEKYEQYRMPMAWLVELKGKCDEVGIEFMCTTYLLEDIGTVAPYVDRFKISAYESQWHDFVDAHADFNKQIIISQNPDAPVSWIGAMRVRTLHCISDYPTYINQLKLRKIQNDCADGLSDHTTSTISGAVAVGCGATILEKHIRPFSLHAENPDYPHSLACEGPFEGRYMAFGQYVQNVREAELML